MSFDMGAYSMGLNQKGGLNWGFTVHVISKIDRGSTMVNFEDLCYTLVSL